MKEISLSLEYQQARRNYKASKSSSNAGNKENEQVNIPASTSAVARKTIRKSKNRSSIPKDRAVSLPNAAPNDGSARLASRRSSATPKLAIPKDRAVSLPNSAPNDGAARLASKTMRNDALPPPTKERGLELLGLVRPSDSRAEYGLSNAIQSHLIESIKLCSLKSRRETSLIDMVKTLCKHLSNRENEITTWTEFADTAMITAASKLHDSLGRFHQACAARDDARESAKRCQMALHNIRKQYASIKELQNVLKQDVVEILSTIPPLFSEMKNQLHLKVGFHTDYLHSECKTEVCDAVEELARAHDIEKQQLETEIHSLTQTVHSGEEKIRVLQDQNDSCMNDLDAEKARYSELQDELKRAQDIIKHLEQKLEDEQLEKQQELSKKDARMNQELDDVKLRVKESFQALSDRKDRDIAAALQRARVAEKVLEELQASLSQMIPEQTT